MVACCGVCIVVVVVCACRLTCVVVSCFMRCCEHVRVSWCVRVFVACFVIDTCFPCFVVVCMLLRVLLCTCCVLVLCACRCSL